MTTPQSEETWHKDVVITMGIVESWLESTPAALVHATWPEFKESVLSASRTVRKIKQSIDSDILKKETNQKLQEFVILAEQALTNLHGVKNPELTGTVLEETMVLFTNKQWASEAIRTLQSLLAQMQEKENL